MADRSGLRLVGFIFAGVTFAVMLTTTIIVKGYSDGVYSLESAALEHPCKNGCREGAGRHLSHNVAN